MQIFFYGQLYDGLAFSSYFLKYIYIDARPILSIALIFHMIDGIGLAFALRSIFRKHYDFM